MIIVLGGAGFVGSAYARLFARLGLPHTVVTRANGEALRGMACDVLINANGNSRKFLADRQPLDEFDASVRSVAEAIDRFKPTYVVHLSTGDVYPDTTEPATTREEQIIDPTRLSRYGLHKYLAEQLVQGTQKHWLVVRMGGFVGPGLKKNAVFDMINNAPVWLAPQSRLQFIDTDRAAEIIWTIIGKRPENQIINLGGQGMVHLGELHAAMGSKSEFRADAPTVTYELATERLARLYGGTLPESIAEVRRFIERH